MLHLLIDKDAPQDLIEETFSARTADVNALNDAGLTPLLRAIQLKRWSLVREILKIDVIDPTIHGEQQLPALMMALDMKADTETLNKVIIYLTDHGVSCIFTAWKRQRPYSKQSYISPSLRTAMPL
jgi:ankyrin repeat protein